MLRHHTDTLRSTTVTLNSIEKNDSNRYIEKSQTRKQEFQEVICQLRKLQQPRCVHSAWPA